MHYTIPLRVGNLHVEVTIQSKDGATHSRMTEIAGSELEESLRLHVRSAFGGWLTTVARETAPPHDREPVTAAAEKD